MLTALASLAAVLSSAAATAEQAEAPPPACAGREHRQFDFWVGDWDVYPTGRDSMVARSRVESLHDGCVIRERWMPLKGGGGSSLNHYDRSQGRWHQTWIDSGNARVVFEGGLVDGRMVLQGFWKGAKGPGGDGLVRMTYTRSKDGSVRQAGEISTDHGVTFKPFFDLTYRPGKSTS